MRFYGLHSGRNNIARYLARSYMWNNRNNKNKNNIKTSTTLTDNEGNKIMLYMLAFFVVLVLYLIF